MGVRCGCGNTFPGPDAMVVYTPNDTIRYSLDKQRLLRDGREMTRQPVLMESWAFTLTDQRGRVYSSERSDIPADNHPPILLEYTITLKCGQRKATFGSGVMAGR